MIHGGLDPVIDVDVDECQPGIVGPVANHDDRIVSSLAGKAVDAKSYAPTSLLPHREGQARPRMTSSGSAFFRYRR
jgi:hypothetical protein